MNNRMVKKYTNSAKLSKLKPIHSPTMPPTEAEKFYIQFDNICSVGQFNSNKKSVIRYICDNSCYLLHPPIQNFAPSNIFEYAFL